MMHFEEDFLLVDKEVAEESGREELQAEEEAVGGGDELSEYQDECPDAKYFRCMYEWYRQKKKAF